MRLLLLLLAVLLLPVPALAYDWGLLAHNESDKIYVDRSSIQPLSGGHYRFWMKKVEKNGENEKTTMWLLEVSCTGQFRRLDYKDMGTLDKSGNRVLTIKEILPDVKPDQYVTDWSYSSPETPEQSAEMQICNRK